MWRATEPKRGVVALLALALGAAGCAGGEALRPDPTDGQQTQTVEKDAGGGLSQTVRLTPAEPATGDTLRVVSVVRNQGGGAARVETRICGLDLAGSLPLSDPFLRCAGYSMRADLAAGDSVVQGDQAVVAGKAGSYTLRVRHLLEPEQWVETTVRVRQR